MPGWLTCFECSNVTLPGLAGRVIGAVGAAADAEVATARATAANSAAKVLFTMLLLNRWGGPVRPLK
jgi:hypothetical protein